MGYSLELNMLVEEDAIEPLFNDSDESAKYYLITEEDESFERVAVVMKAFFNKEPITRLLPRSIPKAGFEYYKQSVAPSETKDTYGDLYDEYFDGVTHVSIRTFVFEEIDSYFENNINAKYLNWSFEGRHSPIIPAKVIPKSLKTENISDELYKDIINGVACAIDDYDKECIVGLAI